MIGRLPGTLPGGSKRSQNLPGELPRPPRALRGPSQDALGVTKPNENQQQTKQNNIKHLKTTENEWESNETFTNIKLHARIGYFNWC